MAARDLYEKEFGDRVPHRAVQPEVNRTHYSASRKEGTLTGKVQGGHKPNFGGKTNDELVGDNLIFGRSIFLLLLLRTDLGES